MWVKREMEWYHWTPHSLTFLLASAYAPHANGMAGGWTLPQLHLFCHHGICSTAWCFWASLDEDSRKDGRSRQDEQCCSSKTDEDIKSSMFLATLSRLLRSKPSHWPSERAVYYGLGICTRAGYASWFSSLQNQKPLVFLGVHPWCSLVSLPGVPWCDSISVVFPHVQKKMCWEKIIC